YLKINIPCNKEIQEILIAELGQISYDSFQEMDKALEAYIKEELFDDENLLFVLEKHGISMEIKAEKLQDVNWNEQWEKNFDPVFVDDRVQIRATFHEAQPNFEYDVIINPKMSFGTGHHETTQLIVAEQLEIDHKNKSILDVGTGTGVLAIMGYKLGAKSITVTDIDDWCIDNSRENLELNQVKNFEVLQGTINKLTLHGDYDIIYANINKNVLMDEIPFYSSLLKDKGILVLSGFYYEDINDLKRKAAQNKLFLVNTKNQNNWVMMHLSYSKI
ncbi:MAG: 50S ribosomal protein L11 methyltransferase, partial [Cyclobacteriaceae bacterium]|nr:50S ribosomal protein L11 methyltransferase [Cyclobacteriaceae bacterium]